MLLDKFKTLGIVLLGLASVVAAPRKTMSSGKTPSSVNTPIKPAVETVYVARPVPVASPDIFPNGNVKGSSTGATLGNRDSEGRGNRGKAIPGLNRNYGQAYGVSGGFYNAEVLGSNPYANLFWDLYPSPQPYFFEITAGIGSVQSSFSKSVVGGGVFPNSFMISGEALGGYTYTGLAKSPNQAGGLYPYFMGGITAIYQGGVPNIGAVLAFGNRMNLPFGLSHERWALNYSLRDHIYSQKIRSRPSMTQNFVLLIGVQKYY